MQYTRWSLAAIVGASMLSMLVLASADARPGGEARPQSAKPQAESAQPTQPKAGDAVPAFELKGADGKTYKLADYKDKVVVLHWFNQDCPFCNFDTGVGPRMKALGEKYKGKVVFLAVDSTHGQTAEKDAEYAKKNQMADPILMDSDGKVGHLYGAKTTPHAFVINKGKLVYSGAFDNNPKAEKDKANYRGYVDEVLGAVLAGKEPPITNTDSWGCPVKYQSKKPADK
jgi:peroxiredoxin